MARYSRRGVCSGSRSVDPVFFSRAVPRMLRRGEDAPQQVVVVAAVTEVEE